MSRKICMYIRQYSELYNITSTLVYNEFPCEHFCHVFFTLVYIFVFLHFG
jgi:hypothetical protein